MTTTNQEKQLIDLLVESVLSNDDVDENMIDRIMLASEGLEAETVIACQSMALQIVMMRGRDSE